MMNQYILSGDIEVKKDSDGDFLINGRDANFCEFSIVIKNYDKNILKRLIEDLQKEYWKK